MADIVALPVWALYTQAVAVPVVGAAIAFAGVCIARQQKRLADIKLQNDLYDRRYKVYEAARKYFSDMQINGNASLEEFFAYRRGISDAVFLLPNDIVEYLNSITDQAAKLRLYVSRLENPNLTPEVRGELADKAAAVEEWFSKQFDVLVEKFRPVMRLDVHAL